jgi:hypothetical protein
MFFWVLADILFTGLKQFGHMLLGQLSIANITTALMIFHLSTLNPAKHNQCGPPHRPALGILHFAFCILHFAFPRSYSAFIRARLSDEVSALMSIFATRLGASLHHREIMPRWAGVTIQVVMAPSLRHVPSVD